jgi:AraC-like DNA-binding protein/mannose-6-phosphate isomerase-like protein (cupin superfamily)
MSLNKMERMPFPYQIMAEKPDALDRLDIQFQWGNYGIRILRCHLVAFPPGKTIAFHQHSEYEFHFIPRGKGRVILKDLPFPLQAGMFYMTGPGVEHYQEADSLEAMEELCLHLEVHKLFERDDIPEHYWGNRHEILEADSCIRQLDLLPLRPEVDHYNAMHWFLAAYRSWSSDKLGVYSTIQQAVIQILLKSVQAYEMNINPLAIASRDMNSHRFLLATQFMADNYARPLSLEDVADKLSISSRQLQRVFLEKAGFSFSKYLEDLRLSHVSHDLINSEISVQSIAALHGFTSSNYLYYVFRKHYGMTPIQYRLAHGKSLGMR